MFLQNFRGVRDFIVLSNAHQYKLQDIQSQQIITVPYASLAGIKKIRRDAENQIVPGQQLTLFCKWDGEKWAVFTLNCFQAKAALSKKTTMEEGQETELKSLGVNTYEQDVCAMANSRGGVLWWGIQDDGTVCGIDALIAQYGNQDKLTCYLRNRLSQRTNTNLFLNIQFYFIQKGGQPVLKIVIPKSDEIVLLKNELWVRASNTSQSLTGDRMLSWIYKKQNMKK